MYRNANNIEGYIMHITIDNDSQKKSSTKIDPWQPLSEAVGNAMPHSTTLYNKNSEIENSEIRGRYIIDKGEAFEEFEEEEPDDIRKPFNSGVPRETYDREFEIGTAKMEGKNSGKHEVKWERISDRRI